MTKKEMTEALQLLEKKYLRERRRFDGLRRFATNSETRERAFGEANVCSMILVDIRKILKP